MYINGWMDKKDVVDICNGLLFHYKELNNAIYNNMNGPRDQHKWSKSDRKK